MLIWPDLFKQKQQELYEHFPLLNDEYRKEAFASRKKISAIGDAVDRASHACTNLEARSEEAFNQLNDELEMV